MVRVTKCIIVFFSLELPEAEPAAVASRMPFCSQDRQEAPFGLLSVDELSLGLQSLSLPCWEQPWNSTEPELPERLNSPKNSEYHSQLGHVYNI